MGMMVIRKIDQKISVSIAPRKVLIFFVEVVQKDQIKSFGYIKNVFLIGTKKIKKKLKKKKIKISRNCPN